MSRRPLPKEETLPTAESTEAWESLYVTVDTDSLMQEIAEKLPVTNVKKITQKSKRNIKVKLSNRHGRNHDKMAQTFFGNKTSDQRKKGPIMDSTRSANSLVHEQSKASGPIDSFKSLAFWTKHKDMSSQKSLNDSNQETAFTVKVRQPADIQLNMMRSKSGYQVSRLSSNRVKKANSTFMKQLGSSFYSEKPALAKEDR